MHSPSENDTVGAARSNNSRRVAARTRRLLRAVAQFLGNGTLRGRHSPARNLIFRSRREEMRVPITRVLPSPAPVTSIWRSRGVRGHPTEDERRVGMAMERRVRGALHRAEVGHPQVSPYCRGDHLERATSRSPRSPLSEVDREPFQRWHVP